MEVAVARHHETLDSAIAAHSGVRPVEQGEGGSIAAALHLAVNEEPHGDALLGYLVDLDELLDRLRDEHGVAFADGSHLHCDQAIDGAQRIHTGTR